MVGDIVVHLSFGVDVLKVVEVVLEFDGGHRLQFAEAVIGYGFEIAEFVAEDVHSVVPNLMLATG